MYGPRTIDVRRITEKVILRHKDAGKADMHACLCGPTVVAESATTYTHVGEHAAGSVTHVNMLGVA